MIQENMQKKLSLSFCFPCYNDGGTIGSLVIFAHEKIKDFTDDFEIIVVNDGSQDQSSKILESLKKKYPDTLKVIHHARNRGYGAALLSAFQAAQKDWVGYTDGDAQYDLDELDRMIPFLRDNVDWVQGFKGRRRDPWYRIVVGLIYQKFIKLMFNLRIRDVDCDFRFMRRDILQALGLSRTTGCICVELVKKMELAGARVFEVQVSHYFRLHGKSQFFNIRRVSKTLWGLSGVWWECFRIQKKLGSASVTWQEYRQKLQGFQKRVEIMTDEHDSIERHEQNLPK